jgi:hypothetical protein
MSIPAKRSRGYRLIAEDGVASAQMQAADLDAAIARRRETVWGRAEHG